jgi:hypothetical protein
VGWGIPILEGKKDKFKDNSVKRSILNTFGATKAQKRLKRGKTIHIGSYEIKKM